MKIECRDCEGSGNIHTHSASGQAIRHVCLECNGKGEVEVEEEEEEE